MSLALAGCRLPPANAGPSIEFRRVPPAREGGTESLATIEGRVRGTQPGQRIVLYARSGTWWVQPYRDAPFTDIGEDSSWTNRTHLGTEYAALLVEAGYRPPATTDTLPSPGHGVVALASVSGEPPFWRTREFGIAAALAAIAVAWTVHRLRVRQLTSRLNARFEERLAERTRVAQELYDTLLQGLLGTSMRLHLVLDEVPPGSPERSRLDGVLHVLGQAIEEGRTVLQGLRARGDGGDRLEDALRRIAEELGTRNAVDCRVIVEGQARPLHPIIHDEVYALGREALMSAVRDAEARGIELEVEYSAKALRLAVRDDGRPHETAGLEAEGGAPPGLTRMRERADRIGARLRVRRLAPAGTEVELSIPAGVAFR